MFSTQRHTGFDSNGRFDGTKKFYHAFVSALDDAFDAAQIAWVVDLVGFPHPVPPYQSLAREGVGAALIPGDTQLLKDFRRSNQDQNEKSSKAMSILKGMLGPIPTALIDPILADPRLSTRAKVVAAKLRLAAEYGMGNATSISAHIGDMDELPPILDGPSALQFISSLIMLNSVLRKMGAPQSDDQLRQRLYKNLIAPMFEKVALDIGANAAMTFAEACTAIQNIIDVKTMPVTYRLCTLLSSRGPLHLPRFSLHGPLSPCRPRRFSRHLLLTLLRSRLHYPSSNHTPGILRLPHSLLR
jgi:hypothetical protein